MEFFIFCDGSCYNSPGKNSVGYAAVLTDHMFPTFDNILDKQLGSYLEGTNNEAEWAALVAGMELMLKHNKIIHKYVSYHIFTDSNLIVNQANGNYKIRKKNLFPYVAEYKELLKQARSCRISFSIKWISRKQNKIADYYSKCANPYFNFLDN